MRKARFEVPAALFILLILGTQGQAYSLSITSVTIRVQYGGAWSGAWGSAGNAADWNGSGTRTLTLNSPGGDSLWVVTANAQKDDASTAILTVSILAPNGTVLNSASTSAPYGAAQTSYLIENTGPIPEFPSQTLIAAVFTLVIITSYLVLRRQGSESRPLAQR